MDTLYVSRNDYMHELYNNKNPYRIQDIYAEGTIDNRSIAESDGKLFFADEDDIKIYTGGNPRGIGRPLNVDKFTKAIAGSDGRKYYLYCEDAENESYLFVYDTLIGQWAQESMTFEVLAFAHNKVCICYPQVRYINLIQTIMTVRIGGSKLICI